MYGGANIEAPYRLEAVCPFLNSQTPLERVSVVAIVEFPVTSPVLITARTGLIFEDTGGVDPPENVTCEVIAA